MFYSFQRVGVGESPIRMDLWNGLVRDILNNKVGMYGVPPLKG
ncbi:hypothetical protein QFZ87_002376 [Bacillus sp. SLBN-46]|nr:hypothetical protein [Bacillus sp. SLBN-46]